MKTQQTLFLVSLMIHVCSYELCYGQDKEWRHPVEYQAEPISGFDEYLNNIGAQIDRKNLPDSVSGRVFIHVLVKVDSTISEIRVIKSNCEICNEEALRVVKSDTTKWKPYSINGVQRESRKIFPIHF